MGENETMSATDWFRKGTELAKVGRFAEAVSLYDHALKEEPTHAKALFNRAVCLKNLKRYQEALEGFKKAQRQNPTDADIQTRLTQLEALLKKERLTDSQSSLNSLASATTKRSWALYGVFALCVSLLLWAAITAVTSRTAPKPASTNIAPVEETMIVPKGDFSPPKGKETGIVSSLKNDYSMLTGKFLVSPKDATGSGKLDLDNDTTQDAVVKIAYGPKLESTFCIVYLEMGGRVRLAGMKARDYHALVMIGRDWEPFRHRFRLVSSYDKTADPIIIASNPEVRRVALLSLPSDSSVADKDFLEAD